jgi:hypothetical protein
MPCRDEYAEAASRLAYSKRCTAIEAMLCAFVTALSEKKSLHQTSVLTEVLDVIDWKEAGVTRKEFNKWWDEHLRQDREKRLAARQARRQRRLRRAALNKLSAAEREAIGAK